MQMEISSRLCRISILNIRTSSYGGREGGGTERSGLAPGAISFKANEACVRLLRGHVDRTDTDAPTHEGTSNLALIQRETAISFPNTTVLEVGTGWHGIDLVLFHLVGARQIYSGIPG